MTSINNLSSTDTLTAGDLLPVWRTNNSDTRKVSLFTLTDYLQTNLSINNISVTATGSLTARTLANRFAVRLEAEDFGAVGDGAWNPTGFVLSGTINTATITAASQALEDGRGGTLRFGALGYRSGPLTLNKSVTWEGENPGHWAFWNSGQQPDGTGLLIAGLAGAATLTFETDIQGQMGLRNLSIYEAGTAAITAVVDIAGILHWSLEDVSLGCLGTARGIGLNLRKGASGLALYGVAKNITIDNVLTGIKITGDQNANTFIGGTVNAEYLNLHYVADGLLVPRGNVHLGQAFERVYNSGATHTFLAAGSAARRKLIAYADGGSDYDGAVYVVDFMKFEAGVNNSIVGGYMELGSCPATYNNGVNGVAPLVPIIRNSSDGLTISGVDWVNVWLYEDGSTDTQALPYRDGKNYTNSSPVAVTARATGSAQSIPSSTATTLTLLTSQDGSLHGRWKYAAGVWTCLVAGTYAFSGRIYAENLPAGVEFFYCKLVTTIRTYSGANAANNEASAKPRSSELPTVIVPCAAGDTAVFQAFHTSGGAVDIQAYGTESYFTIREA